MLHERSGGDGFGGCFGLSWAWPEGIGWRTRIRAMVKWPGNEETASSAMFTKPTSANSLSPSPHLPVSYSSAPPPDLARKSAAADGISLAPREALRNVGFIAFRIRACETRGTCCGYCFACYTGSDELLVFFYRFRFAPPVAKAIAVCSADSRRLVCLVAHRRAGGKWCQRLESRSILRYALAWRSPPVFLSI